MALPHTKIILGAHVPRAARMPCKQPVMGLIPIVSTKRKVLRMKIEVSQKLFKPITITLETQDELDQLYGIFNCAEINDMFPIAKSIHKFIVYKKLHSPVGYKWFNNLRQLLY